MVVCLLALVRAGAAGETQAASGPFGIAYRAVSLPSGGTGHVLRIDLDHARIRVLDARDYGDGSPLTAKQFAEFSGATAVVNASFFDVDGSAMGLLVVDGAKRQALRPVDWGVFAVGDDDSIRIVHTDAWPGEKGVAQAIQSGPRLVVGGKVVQLKRQAAERTAVCRRADGKVELLVTRRATTLDALAQFLAAEGCVDALNLDGGPSSQLFLGRAGVSIDVPGGWGVPIALGVFVEGVADIRPERRGCRGD
jgi:uncharacterized protein YigE (DUF2233 family)